MSGLEDPQRNRTSRAPTSPLVRGQGLVLLAIAAGGALGAPARYEVAQLVPITPGTFPWATFWTNVSGAFALGILLTIVIERFPPTRFVRPFFGIGFLGAYTTFSTLAVETATLVKDGNIGLGVGYTLASVAVGLVSAYLGFALGRALPIERRRVATLEEELEG
jgi:CrcB protein